MKEYDINRTLKQKEDCERKVDNYLNILIAKGDQNSLKKASLVSSHLKDFINQVSFEDNFDPKRMKSYSRGDIIHVNLGLRIGSEMGGYHFAVVIRDCPASASVVNIIPLSSTDGKEVKGTNIDLGSALYDSVANVYHKKLDLLNKEIVSVKNEIMQYTTEAINSNDDTPETYQRRIKALKKLEPKAEMIGKEISALETHILKISNLKTGSMAVMNQITTVSKIRIDTPKKKSDFLSGVSFDQKTMKLIDNALKEMFL